MNNRTGCLIVHGFGGNIDEVKPLAEFMEDKGFIIFCPSLKGHTGDKKSLSNVSYKDWIESAENGLKYLISKCDRVIVIGFSMGGLIGVHLATRYNIYALATLSSPIYYWDVKRIFLNILQDIKSRNFTNLKRYKNTSNKLPFSALINFRIILSKTKPLFRKIKCPLFIAQGLLDDTVNYRSAKYIYNNSKSEIKEIRYYKNSSHQICLSPDRNILFEDLECFVNMISL